MKNKVLLTGGAGFIGSHLSESLLEQNFEVICLDNFDDYYDRSIKENNISELVLHQGFKLVEGDIRDELLLDSLFKEYNFSLIIHIAAKAGVRPSVIDPKKYYDVNINGTLNILETARKHGVTKLIFASSSSVYGNNKKVPFSENDFVDNPISPYAASKRSGELLCYTYHSLYGFDISCLRFFTVYGPRQRPDLAIHKFARLILDGNPVPVYGDGSYSRDFTYIDDIIFGINQGIKYLKGYNIFNFGNSKSISVIEMIKVLEDALGKKADIEFIDPQPGDVTRTFADISKARKYLNYDPKFNFEKGIMNFVDWMEN